MHLCTNPDCGAATDAAHVPLVKNLYKVVISGDTADTAFGNIFSDDLYFLADRKSPIVVYMELTDDDALELAQHYTRDFSVTRARANWSI